MILLLKSGSKKNGLFIFTDNAYPFSISFIICGNVNVSYVLKYNTSLPDFVNFGSLIFQKCIGFLFFDSQTNDLSK